jgi:hypothetical protein
MITLSHFDDGKADLVDQLSRVINNWLTGQKNQHFALILAPLVASKSCYIYTLSKI